MNLNLFGKPKGDRRANQGLGHLQPGFRPDPEIVYIWGLNGPDRLPKPSKLPWWLERSALNAPTPVFVRV